MRTKSRYSKRRVKPKLSAKNSKPKKNTFFANNAAMLKDLARITFGLMWAVDAAFKFQKVFFSGFSTMLVQASQGQPQWLMPWFNFWINMTASNPGAFAAVIAVLETVLAITLIFGFARKITYAGGFLLSLVIYATAEGFGGPYVVGATDIGTSIIYMLVFVLLAILDATYGTSRLSIDYLIEKKTRIWKRIAEMKY